jgi:hypothetical protein
VGVQRLEGKATIGWDCVRLRLRGGVYGIAVQGKDRHIYIAFVQPEKRFSDQSLQIRI